MRRLMRPALLLLLVAVVTLAGIARTRPKTCTTRARTPRLARVPKPPMNSSSKPTTSSPRTCATGRRSNALALRPPRRWFTTVRNCATTASSTKPSPSSRKRCPSIRRCSSPSRNGTAPRRLSTTRRNPPPQAAGPPSSLVRRVQEAAGPVETGSHLQRPHHRQDDGTEIRRDLPHHRATGRNQRAVRPRLHRPQSSTSTSMASPWKKRWRSRRWNRKLSGARLLPTRFS